MRGNDSGRLARYTSAEERLLSSFECLFKRANDAAFVLDKHGRLLDINGKAVKMTNMKRELFVGKLFKEILPPQTLPKARRVFLQTLKGKPGEFEIEFMISSSKTLLLEVNTVPCTHKREIIGILGTVQNVTEKKRTDQKLRESEERYRTLVESLPEAVYTLSKDGTFTSCNSTCEKMTGWSRDEWIGKHFKPICHPDDLQLAVETFERASSGETVEPYELRILTKSGEYIVGEFLSRPHIENGQVMGEFGIIRDITARKKAEEALRVTETKFRALFEDVPDGVYQSSPAGKILTANPTLVRMLGYSSLEELRTVDIARSLYLNPRDRKAWMRRLDKENEVRNAELVLKRKDGRKLVVLENSHAVRDERGKVVHYAGTLTDITERKALEERLSTLNQYAGRINAAHGLQEVYRLTLNALEKTLGFCSAAFMVVERGKLNCAIQRGFREPRLKLPLDGSKRGLTVKAANMHKPVLSTDVTRDKDYVEGMPDTRSEVAVPVEIDGRVVGVLDVESRKPAAFGEKDVELLQILASHAATAISNLEKREEIEKRSVQLALLMKLSAEMIHSTDLQWRLQKIAEAITEYGWQRVVIRAVRNKDMELVNPEDMVTTGLTKEEREFLWKNRQPGQVWRERFGSEYERFKVGEFYHLPWSDPWVRKRFARGTVSSKLSQESMVDWNPEDLLYAPLRLANGQIVGILSIDDPVDGKRPTKESLAPLELFIHQAAVAIENAQLFQQLRQTKNQLRQYADRLEMKVKERTQELVEAQNKLVKSERLAAIGEVAAMVGHDLRNPLTGIAGATYYLKNKLGSRMDQKAGEMFELIEKDIEYSNKIVTDLLDYSREMQLELREITPREIVSEALSSVRIPENITVLNHANGELKMRVDVKKLQRVFINLIKNAVDAMPCGGKLTIKSKKANGNVEISFADTGAGIPHEILGKLWTPFLTTKAKGMGLGLPICRRIVEAHGGKIAVRSNTKEGTTFTVRVPAKLRIENGGENVWLNLPESLLSTMTKA